MKFTPNTVTFACSGRTVSAYAGVLGLGPDGFIGGGFDSTLFEPHADEDTLTREENLTAAEREELAEFMIAAWSEVWERARDDICSAEIRARRAQ